jgi:hypothetical protein
LGGKAWASTRQAIRRRTREIGRGRRLHVRAISDESRLAGGSDEPRHEPVAQRLETQADLPTVYKTPSPRARAELAK